MNNNYFVTIQDPVSLHAFLLFASKSSIELSIKYQELTELKKEKIESLAKLKEDVAQMNSLLLSLEELLPHKELLVNENPEPEKEKPVKKTAKTKKKSSQIHSTRTSYTKLEKLQSTLAEIERRLEDIS